jgi:uncharacterized protein (TIGR00255 family)
MTAFARKELTAESGTAIWEIRTINHRYIELNLRLPEFLRGLEPIIREHVTKQISRGKVEANLVFNENSVLEQIHINVNLVKQLLEAASQIDRYSDKITPLRMNDILKWPGIIESKSKYGDQLQELILTTFDQCFNEIIQERKREGEVLKGFLLQRLSGIEAQLKVIKKRIPNVNQQIQKKLWQRYENLKIDCDPGRLEQEIALQLQKMDVSEELDRLQAHIQEVERILFSGGIVGRRIEFLLQELNREANTLGAKSLDPEMTNCTVEVKVLIDQMREQVQNIE